jgi:GT2 family glycosyltransferase
MEAPIRLVCATRKDRSGFIENSALGRSLAMHRQPGIELRLFADNRSGLPAVYNQALREAVADPAILVFLHDDVCLCDYHWPERVRAALNAFSLIGVAGNRRRRSNQPSWAFIDDRWTWDCRENLSGTVAHGKGFEPQQISHYGPSGQEVKLLDGVFLATHSQTLHSHKMQFDEAFTFDFYDLDLCRQAEEKGIRIGTWPIALIHESGGNFGTDAWHKAYSHYLAKWGD